MPPAFRHALKDAAKLLRRMQYGASMDKLREIERLWPQQSGALGPALTHLSLLLDAEQRSLRAWSACADICTHIHDFSVEEVVEFSRRYTAHLDNLREAHYAAVSSRMLAVSDCADGNALQQYRVLRDARRVRAAPDGGGGADMETASGEGT